MNRSTKPETTKAERDRVRDQFVWLYNNVQDRVGILGNNPDAETKSQWFEDEPDEWSTRPLHPKDVDVTVKWSRENNHLAHLGTIEGSTAYTLGIHFTRWRSRGPEQKLAILGHELGHCRYGCHESYYWEFAFQIWEEILNHKGVFEDWFTTDDPSECRPAYLNDPIDWEYFQTLLLDDVYDSAPTHERDELVEMAEDYFGRSYNCVNALDWKRKLKGRGLSTVTVGWSDDTEPVDVTDIKFIERLPDSELTELVSDLEPHSIGLGHMCMPEIRGTRNPDGTITITKNEPYAAIIARTNPPDAAFPLILD